MADRAEAFCITIIIITTIHTHISIVDRRSDHADSSIGASICEARSVSQYILSFHGLLMVSQSSLTRQSPSSFPESQQQPQSHVTGLDFNYGTYQEAAKTWSVCCCFLQATNLDPTDLLQPKPFKTKTPTAYSKLNVATAPSLLIYQFTSPK